MRPYIALARFQNHQQACMEGFQVFLKPEGLGFRVRVDVGIQTLGPALEGPSAAQEDRVLPPEVFLRQDNPGAGIKFLPPISQGTPAIQQGRIPPPEQFLGVLQSPTKAGSPPALARPIPRTAPVPLAGLYAKVRPMLAMS